MQLVLLYLFYGFLLVRPTSCWMTSGNIRVGTFEELLAEGPGGDNAFVIGLMARDEMETHMTTQALMTHHVTMVTMAIVDFVENGWLRDYTFV